MNAYLSAFINNLFIYATLVMTLLSPSC